MSSITLADITAVLRARDEMMPVFKAAAAAARTAQKEISGSLGDIGKSSKELEKALSDMQERLNRFEGGKIKADADEYAKAVQNVGGVSKLTRAEQESLNTVLQEATAKYRALGETAPAEIRDLAAETKALLNATEPVPLSLDQIATSARSLGTALTIGVTAPLTAAAAASLKFSSDYEANTVKLVTLSGVSEQTMHGMRDAMLEMAPAVGQGPGELSRAMLAVTSTGIRGAEATDILNTAAKGAAVGMGDATVIARTLTSIIQAYGAENITASHAAEVLFKTVVEGNAEADELAGSLGRVIAIASQAGVSIEQVGAYIATFTRLGVNSAEAVTALRGTLQEINHPSAKAREELGQLGMTFAQLRQEIREKGLTEAMINLVKLTDGHDEAIQTIIPNVRALAGVLGTAGSQAESMRQIQVHLNAETDEMNAAFARTKETTAFAMKEMAARAETLAVSFGDKLQPAFKSVLSAAGPVLTIAKDLVDAFGLLPGPVQLVVIALGGVAAAAGPVLFAAGGLISSWSKVTLVLGEGSTVVGLLTGALALVGPVIAVIATAFASWEIGTWLGRVTGLTNGIEWLTSRLMGLSSAEIEASRNARDHIQALKDFEEQRGRLTTTAANAGAKDIQLKVDTKKATEDLTAAQKLAAGMAEVEQHSLSNLSDEAKKLANAIFAAGGTMTTALTALKKHQLATAEDESAVKRLHEAYVDAKKASDAIKKAHEEARLALIPLTEAQQNEAKALLALGVSHKSVAIDIGASEVQVRRFEQSLKDSAAQAKLALVELDRVAVATKAMADIKPDSKGLYGLGMSQTALASRTTVATGTSFAPDLSAFNAGKQQKWHLTDPLGSALDDLTKKAPQMIANAFTGGGGIGGALNAGAGLFGSSLMSNVFGAPGKGGILGSMTGTLSTFLGSAVPVIGSLLGPAIQGIGSLFGKLFGDPEKEINPVREAYVQAAGGLASLNAKAMAATGSLKLVQNLLAAKDADQYKVAIDALNTAFDTQKKTLADNNTELANLLSNAKQVGGSLPASLKLAIQPLIDMGKITGDNAALFASLTGETGTNFSKMQELAQKYGIDLADLGPAFQSAKLGDTAASVINDFQTLKDGGMDVDKVLAGLRRPINDIVNDSIKFGVAIPENMRPWVEQLEKTGQLVDGNGDKLTDLSALKFSPPIVTEFDKIVKKLQELIDKIAAPGGVNAAIAAIPTNVDVNINGHWNPPDMSDLPPVQQMAAGGSGRATGPMMFYTAGNEDFAFSGEGKRFASDGGGGNRDDEIVQHLEDLNNRLAFVETLSDDLTRAMRVAMQQQ